MGTILSMSLLPPFNQVLLILPIFMLLQSWVALRRFARITLAALLSWPWLAGLGLLLFLPRQPDPLNRISLLPSSATLVLPLLLPLLLVDRRKLASSVSSPFTPLPRA
jgi:hypothetical protein